MSWESCIDGGVFALVNDHGDEADVGEMDSHVDETDPRATVPLGLGLVLLHLLDFESFLVLTLDRSGRSL